MLVRINTSPRFFFVKNSDCYTRHTDSVRQRAYSQNTLKRLLSQAGFDTLAVYDDMTTQPLKMNSERMVFVTQRR